MIVAVLTLLTSTDLRAGQATILLYHRFEDERHPGTSTSLKDFYNQMKFLKEHGYRVIPLKDLVKLLEERKPIPDKAVVITIDDGYRSTMKAFEILKEFDFPFTIFLYMEAVGRYPDFLTFDDIKKLLEFGKADFENHSYSHRAFGFDVNLREFLEDLEKSEERFERIFGRKPEFYAFPYGFYNLALVEVLRQRGYRAVFTQDPGNVDVHSDPFRLSRQAVVGSWSRMDHFIRRLNRENLPVEDFFPDPGFLEQNPPPKIGGRLKFPSRYSDCEVYVSELGWMKVERSGAEVFIKVNRVLQRKWNRIGIRCRNNDTGMWAEAFWMVMGVSR